MKNIIKITLIHLIKKNAVLIYLHRNTDTKIEFIGRYYMYYHHAVNIFTKYKINNMIIYNSKMKTNVEDYVSINAYNNNGTILVIMYTMFYPYKIIWRWHTKDNNCFNITRK